MADGVLLVPPFAIKVEPVNRRCRVVWGDGMRRSVVLVVVGGQRWVPARAVVRPIDKEDGTWKREVWDGMVVITGCRIDCMGAARAVCDGLSIC